MLPTPNIASEGTSALTRAAARSSSSAAGRRLSEPQLPSQTASQADSATLSAGSRPGNGGYSLSTVSSGETERKYDSKTDQVRDAKLQLNGMLDAHSAIAKMLRHVPGETDATFNNRVKSYHDGVSKKIAPDGDTQPEASSTTDSASRNDEFQHASGAKALATRYLGLNDEQAAKLHAEDKNALEATTAIVSSELPEDIVVAAINNLLHGDASYMQASAAERPRGATSPRPLSPRQLAEREHRLSNLQKGFSGTERAMDVVNRLTEAVEARYGSEADQARAMRIELQARADTRANKVRDLRNGAEPGEDPLVAQMRNEDIAYHAALHKFYMHFLEHPNLNIDTALATVKEHSQKMDELTSQLGKAGAGEHADLTPLETYFAPHPALASQNSPASARILAPSSSAPSSSSAMRHASSGSSLASSAASVAPNRGVQGRAMSDPPAPPSLSSSATRPNRSSSSAPNVQRAERPPVPPRPARFDQLIGNESFLPNAAALTSRFYREYVGARDLSPVYSEPEAGSHSGSDSESDHYTGSQYGNPRATGFRLGEYAASQQAGGHMRSASAPAASATVALERQRLGEHFQTLAETYEPIMSLARTAEYNALHTRITNQGLPWARNDRHDVAQQLLDYVFNSPSASGWSDEVTAKFLDLWERIAPQ